MKIDKEIKFIAALSLFILTFGCITQEEVPKSYEDIKVLYAGSKISRVAPNTSTFVVITVLNNVLGEEAKNIMVSLENVEPFLVIEPNSSCENGCEPNTTRSWESFFGYTCDRGKEVREHCMTRLAPGDIVDFFWILRAPDRYQIGNMVYTHKMYYTITYDYTATVIYRIGAINERELVAGRRTSNYVINRTASPIRFEGQTPDLSVIYNSDYPRKGYLYFALSPEPGAGGTLAENITVEVKYPDSNYLSGVSNEVGEELGWRIDGDTAIKEITPLEFGAGINLKLPIYLPPSSDPVKNLDFKIVFSYKFIKYGSFDLTVVPIKV